ncbi:MAG: hypothetical protein NW226_20445 [Microscillaceae bacterium]|nr:hypothetical protein [Microscillaceae bacterium]
MIKRCTTLILGLTLFLVAQIPTQAQILNKLKKKAEEKLLGKDKEEENKQNNPFGLNNTSNSGSVQGKKLIPSVTHSPLFYIIFINNLKRDFTASMDAVSSSV